MIDMTPKQTEEAKALAASRWPEIDYNRTWVSYLGPVTVSSEQLIDASVTVSIPAPIVALGENGQYRAAYFPDYDRLLIGCNHDR